MDIITDSCSDLGPELAERYRISILPLMVYLNEKTYLDGQLTQQELFSSVERTGELPKTSAVSVGEFLRKFEQSDDPIFIGISSQLSATIQNARLAADQVRSKNVAVVDSLNLSSGIALLVLQAADLRDRGCSKSEIIQFIEEAVGKIHSSFVIDTFDYIYKGGRCTAIQAVVGSMLRIRPVIAVQPDGKLGVKEKLRGTRRRALESLLQDFQANLPQVELTRVFITHTGSDEEAAWLKEELLKRAPLQEVIISRAGATISSHCGPNTIGILYMLH